MFKKSSAHFSSISFGAFVCALVSSAPVMAADLPSKKAKPVEYVKVCTEQGEGFFYIPGTQTCLKIGGLVRAETRYFEPLWTAPGDGRAQHALGYRSRGQVNLDARTMTEYGLLRTFMRYEMNADTGNYANPAVNASINRTYSLLEKAFIQFGGITAGRTSSFFDFYANDMNFAEIGGSEYSQHNVLAYTHSVGKYSITLGVEDRTLRDTTAGAFTYGGMRSPDIVGSLRYDDEKGILAAAQLSGALHQVRPMNRNLQGNYIDSEYGYAIQAGLKFNLPALAEGDVLWLQAAYADGALSYLGANGIPNTLGVLNLIHSDAAIVNGSVSKTKGYAVTAAFTHYWRPTLRSNVYGSFISLDYSAQAAGFVDTRIMQAGTALIWSPVANLDLGAEVLYHHIDPKGAVALPVVGTRGAEGAVETRLRIQRSF
jgi:hypothetical protein